MTDTEALLVSWSLYVAGRIGITPPTDEFAVFLRRHLSEAEACMELSVFAQLRAEIGEQL
jgi:hypothetical protein